HGTSKPAVSHFFLEVDRSTEILQTVVTRALCYREHYRSGGFAAQFGRRNSEFEQFPFRVLIVVRTAERRDDLARRLLSTKPPVLVQTWLTTFPRMLAQPLGTIWLRPLDYRNVSTVPLSGQTYQEIKQHPGAGSQMRKLSLLAISSSVPRSHLNH